MDPHNPIIERNGMDPEIRNELTDVRFRAIGAAIECLGMAASSKNPMADLLCAQRQINAALASAAALDPEEAGLMIRAQR
jgi:hypothetical protein